MKHVLSKVGLDVHKEKVLLALITPHSKLLTVLIRKIHIPYSAKFSRRIIFAFSADWHRTSKIKLREILEYRIYN